MISTETRCLPLARTVELLHRANANLEAELRRAAPGEQGQITASITQMRAEIRDAERDLARCVAANPISTPGRLGSGVELSVGQSITAPGGFSTLIMQPDGNLVLYVRRPEGQVSRWASGTNGQRVTSCLMQTDGNLVLYDGAQPVWATGSIAPGAHLALQDDENLVILQGSKPVWASETSLDGTPVTSDGIRAFYLRQGVRHLIRDRETFETAFGGWGAVTTVVAAELGLWPESDPASSADSEQSAGDIQVMRPRSRHRPHTMERRPR